MGVTGLHAAGGLPARGGIQDHPPAPPLPAAPDGAADRAHLAGGRRGGARAAARLHDPVDPPGRSPSGVSEEAANRETLRRLEGSKVRTAVTLDVFGQLTKQGRLGLGPDDLLDDLAAGEHVHGRNGHDAVTLGYGGVLVDVELDDVDLVRVLGG